MLLQRCQLEEERQGSPPAIRIGVCGFFFGIFCLSQVIHTHTQNKPVNNVNVLQEKTTASTAKSLEVRSIQTTELQKSLPFHLKFSPSTKDDQSTSTTTTSRRTQEQEDKNLVILVGSSTDQNLVDLKGSTSRPLEGMEDNNGQATQLVYAWYVQRPKNSPQKDAALIATWKAAWRSYGYDPYVLGFNNAKTSPEVFHNYALSLQDIFNPEYPRHEAAVKPCYHRYLAMAAQGGGMMVDLDTTPTDIASRGVGVLPEKFSLYCQVENPPPDDADGSKSSSITKDWPRQLERQYGTPCAAVGSAAEWLRMANLAVWVTKDYLVEAHRHHDADWTDMHALLRLTGLGEVDLVKRRLLKSDKSRGWDTCMFRHL